MASREVMVVGAGAGGLMAAGRAAACGASVTLFEKTDGPGKKLLLSGSTRCNVTNARDLDSFIEMYGANGRFLHPSFNRFFRDDLLAFLARYWVATLIEPDGRIFPASNRASDVLNAFRRYTDENGVRLKTVSDVLSIKAENGGVIGVETRDGFTPAGAVILATGGASYPGTGSNGDGYRMAATLGHSIVKIRPALVPLTVREVDLAGALQGVSLRHVRLTSYQCPADMISPDLPLKDTGRGTGVRARLPVVESRTGDMLITHFGISGPAVLAMSLAVYDALKKGPVSVSIDLRPDTDAKTLSGEIQSYLDAHGRRHFGTLLSGLLPERVASVFLRLTGIPAERPGHQITAAERGRVVDRLKSLRFNITGTLPLDVAMVTAGGVSLKEIDPRTMASRLVRGLFFCGEVMDIDADTGGYNLQAAFSTGYVAGEAAADFVKNAI